jgi:hypothetical protein
MLQFPSTAGTHVLGSSRRSARALDVTLDIGFLPSWFAFDSDSEFEARGRRINWGAISGMALSIGFSTAFWAGLAWMIARVWR